MHFSLIQIRMGIKSLILFWIEQGFLLLKDLCRLLFLLLIWVETALFRPDGLHKSRIFCPRLSEAFLLLSHAAWFFSYCLLSLLFLLFSLDCASILGTATYHTLVYFALCTDFEPEITVGTHRQWLEDSKTILQWSLFGKVSKAHQANIS